ncbi:MAG: antibiotic biosynthesis monooxygenase [Dehalococcoidia bacterium]|nr:antibiotic biosynthesis monooxygenase [Dehalococcoidia bacterium]
MSVVKINAIEVPEGRGAELEARFGARAGEVEKMPGFEGFELLRPIEGETRYFVYTRWESEEAFQAWVTSEAFTRGHAGPPAGSSTSSGEAGHPGGHPGGHAASGPVGVGSALLEFEVAQRVVKSE